MYGRCGSSPDARNVFNGEQRRDLVMWNAMLAAYAQQGHKAQALQLFREMQQDCAKADKYTFSSIISLCGHAGSADEAFEHFIAMNVDHGIVATQEHYACMVDLLGRAGWLDEAETFISRMPCQPDFPVWRSLLSACKTHGDMERGDRIAEHVFELDPKNAAPYVLLSSIYAAAGSRNDRETCSNN